MLELLPVAENLKSAWGYRLYIFRFNVSCAKSVQAPAGFFWRSRNVQLSVWGW